MVAAGGRVQAQAESQTEAAGRAGGGSGRAWRTWRRPRRSRQWCAARSYGHRCSISSNCFCFVKSVLTLFCHCMMHEPFKPDVTVSSVRHFSQTCRQKCASAGGCVTSCMVQGQGGAGVGAGVEAPSLATSTPCKPMSLQARWRACSSIAQVSCTCFAQPCCQRPCSRQQYSLALSSVNSA